MNFIALDVETANANMATICQIGIVKFRDGTIEGNWESLIDPEDFFDPVNISVHGIDESQVREAPTIADIYEKLANLLSDEIIVCHTHFDRVAIKRALEKYNLQDPGFTWLDSAKVVRRTWDEFSNRGYGLANITSYLGIDFNHHNALEDARAAGEVMIHAIRKSNLSLEEWLDRANKPISGSYSSNINKEGNPDGPLYGEVIAFTGSLSVSRKEAAKLAAEAGCEVSNSVKQTTSLLVVGDQDISKLAGHKKSSKHRKAEKMIREGYDLRIVGESDFKHIIGVDF